MKSALFIACAASAVAASADAGFVGFVGSVRNSGGYTIMDIFAGVANSSDKFLNVYNANISTTVSGGFYQAAGNTTKTWKPDAANFTSTRSSVDSFMTAGTYSGGAYAGQYYASTNTNGDPNFSGTSWNGTPVSAAASTIPANAGWYTGDPTSIDNRAESLAGLTGRVNGTGASGATYGIWCAHLVVVGENAVLGTDVLFQAYGSAKDGVTAQVTNSSSSFVVPAPGALALLGLAGFARGRRR